MSGVDSKTWKNNALASQSHAAGAKVPPLSPSTIAGPRPQQALDTVESPEKVKASGVWDNKRSLADQLQSTKLSEPLAWRPAPGSPYSSLGALSPREPVSSQPTRAPLAPPPELSAYDSLSALASPAPANSISFSSKPIEVELHSHYNGVLSPQEFVGEVFFRANAQDSMVEAFRALRLAGVGYEARQLFRKAATPQQKAEAAEWILAARQADGDKPHVPFAEAYAMRSLLKQTKRPLPQGQVLGAEQLLQEQLLDVDFPVVSYHCRGNPVADVTEAHHAVMANLAALHALGRPATVTLRTQLPPEGKVIPGAMFATELVRDVYGEFCRMHPDTQVTLLPDEKTKRLLLSRAVVNNRVNDGLTDCQLEGGMEVPGWAFRTLCQPRATKAVTGAPTRPGINIGFLHGLSSAALSETPGDLFEGRRSDFMAALRDGSVVGVDFRGREAAFSRDGVQGLHDLHEFLRNMSQDIGHPVVLRVHVGEGHMQRGKFGNRAARQARTNIDILLTQLESMNLDPQAVEIRLGHATHLSLTQAGRIVALGLPVEVNVGSNLRTGSLTHENKSPVLKLLMADVLREANQGTGHLSIHLSTDGGGVMAGSVADELQRYRDLMHGFFNATYRDGPSLKLRAGDPRELRAVASLLTQAGMQNVKNSYSFSRAKLNRQRDDSDTASIASSTYSVHNSDLKPEISEAARLSLERVAQWDPPLSVKHRR